MRTFFGGNFIKEEMLSEAGIYHPIKLEYYKRINEDENNVSELISDIETPSFGYEKKLIIVRNSGLFKKEGKRKNAELHMS